MLNTIITVVALFKVHETSKPQPFWSTCLLQLPPSPNSHPPIPPLSPFVSSLAVLWAGVQLTNMKKGKTFLKRKKAFVTFYPPSLPLFNPLCTFSSKSNLARFHPPTPFTSFLNPSFSRYSPPSFFPLSLVAPLAAIFRSLLPSTTPPSISRWQHERLPVRW